MGSSILSLTLLQAVASNGDPPAALSYSEGAVTQAIESCSSLLLTCVAFSFDTDIAVALGEERTLKQYRVFVAAALVMTILSSLYGACMSGQYAGLSNECQILGLGAYVFKAVFLFTSLVAMNHAGKMMNMHYSEETPSLSCIPPSYHALVQTLRRSLDNRWGPNSRLLYNKLHACESFRMVVFYFLLLPTVYFFAKGMIFGWRNEWLGIFLESETMHIISIYFTYSALLGSVNLASEPRYLAFEKLFLEGQEVELQSATTRGEGEGLPSSPLTQENEGFQGV